MLAVTASPASVMDFPLGTSPGEPSVLGSAKDAPGREGWEPQA